MGKRILALFLEICLSFALLPIIPAQASESGREIDTSNDQTYGSYTYRENETGITITSCDTAETDGDIVAEIDGRPVTAIGDAAFMNCAYITNIVVPATVTAIGESAFASCSMLCTVSLPEGLTSIGDGALESCTMLSEINIPTSLTELPRALFYGCSYIPSLTIPGTVHSIGDEAFYGCTNLTGITLSEGLESIGEYAFQSCEGLTDVAIPASCAQIGDYAFDGCQGLTTFTVADGNPSYTAVDGVLYTADEKTLVRYPPAKADTSFSIPDACTALDDWSFIGAMTLEGIDLGNVTQIGEDCFYYCTSLQSIVVPEGVTELVGAAFAYCVALTSVTLPTTLVSLGNHCFYSCTALEEINIPNGVTTIGTGCFYNCGSLLHLALPATITDIGEDALGYYDSEEESRLRIDLLQVDNAGSDAVGEYMDVWENGTRTPLYVWFLITGVTVLLAGGIVLIVVLRRHHMRIRPASRHASSRKPEVRSGTGRKKKKQKRRARR